MVATHPRSRGSFTPAAGALGAENSRERTSPNHVVREGCDNGNDDDGSGGRAQGVVGGNINFDIGRR